MTVQVFFFCVTIVQLSKGKYLFPAEFVFVCSLTKKKTPIWHTVVHNYNTNNLNSCVKCVSCTNSGVSISSTKVLSKCSTVNILDLHKT